MSNEQDGTETVSLLQEFGLKEYEARCFLALTRLSTGTAKEISEISPVPRTRVYDAIRVLEARGLVEVRHSSPKRFRSVGIEAATETLERTYDDRLETLQSRLQDIDVRESADEADRMQEVWSMAGHDAIYSRTLQMLEAAETEIVLLVVEDAVLTDALFARLQGAVDRAVGVVVGGTTASAVERLEAAVPGASVFETELAWLVGPEADDEVAISRLLLVDRTTLLVSSYYPDADHGDPDEQAVYATGLENGFVVLVRRLISTGTFPAEEPDR